MDKTQIDRAHTEFSYAQIAADELARAENWDDMERHWSNFLTAFRRVFDRLEKAAVKGDAWLGSINRFRSSDPLMVYLEQARHADEHGAARITDRNWGFTNEIERVIRPDGGVFVRFEMQDAHVELVPVTNRGKTYPVPNSFEGSPISTATPLSLALLGLSYADKVLQDATARANGWPSPSKL